MIGLLNVVNHFGEFQEDALINVICFLNKMKRYVYINDDEATQDLYCDNRLSNRKYTLLNFLPKNLWEQFR